MHVLYMAVIQVFQQIQQTIIMMQWLEYYKITMILLGEKQSSFTQNYKVIQFNAKFEISLIKKSRTMWPNDNNTHIKLL